MEKIGVDKVYKEMELLDVGKTFEETRHRLDFIADFKMHLQRQVPDTGDDGASAHLGICLQFKYTLLH